MKAMKKIGEYTGNEDVERWIDRFELAIELDELSDKEANILSMHLGEAAYDAWKNLPKDKRLDAEEVKEMLRSTFGLRKRDAWQGALGKKVHVGDQVDVVADQIKKLVTTSCRGVDDPIEGISGLILLDALPSNVRDLVTMRLGERITYTYVLTVAKRVWPSNSSLSACGGISVTSVTEGRQTEPSPNKSSTGTTGIRCNCCKRLGHIRRDCPVECYTCGQRGHMRFECARFTRSTVPLNEQVGATSGTGPEAVPNAREEPVRSQQQSIQRRQ